ncbi:hypothetical protein [Vannielia litorea]|uniref:Uncharacterized protein n=1 Tax=Vannielia litorea TaxID=1217970 RepID=A0A1N6DW71_9RHOB|nr:hypothetical protein [Vannielia litorea]SIN75039.1 hypothetical protein SAMN05444002_0077 [Vannielia litorea]
MRQNLANLPLATKVVLIVPAALLLVLLILTTPFLGVPLALAFVAFLQPHLLSPRWWARQFRNPG